MLKPTTAILKRSTKHTTWPSEISPLLFCQRSKWDYRPKTTSINFKERYSNPFTEVAVYSTKITHMQNTHNLQTRYGVNIMEIID